MERIRIAVSKNGLDGTGVLKLKLKLKLKGAAGPRRLDLSAARASQVGSRLCYEGSRRVLYAGHGSLGPLASRLEVCVPRVQSGTPGREEPTMTQERDEVLRANQTYVKNFGDKGKLGLPPARRIAILTCMDARIDPAKLAGLREGDAHVIRNAGGRASDDALRSLVISTKLLGTREWFVIHHTNCGMELFTDEIIRGLLSESLETAALGDGGWRNTAKGAGSRQGEYINWLTIKSQAESVWRDVERIRNHPLVPRDIPIYGYIYQVETGGLIEVPEATAAGRAGS